MWICPRCETRNNAEKCVICGEVRPQEKSMKQVRAHQRTQEKTEVVPAFVEVSYPAQKRSLLLILACVLMALILLVGICIMTVVLTEEKEIKSSTVNTEVLSKEAPVEEGLLTNEVTSVEKTEDTVKTNEPNSETIKPTSNAKSTVKPTEKPATQTVRDKLKQFAEYEFTNVRMQVNAFMPIFECNSFARQTQRVLQYDLLDLNGDGKEEVIISSEITGGESEESVGYSCFSIWTVDQTGDIKCVMAKAGWPSRYAYTYAVVRYNGALHLLESSAGGNSTGQMIERNLYTFKNDTIIEKSAYKYQVFDGVSECSIDHVSSDSEITKNKIDNMEKSITFVIKQIFPNV